MSTSARAASHLTNMPDLEGAPVAGGLNKRPAGFHTEQTLHTPVGFALDNTPSFVLSKRSAGFALNKHSASFVLNKRSASFALNERSACFAKTTTTEFLVRQLDRKP